MQDLQAPRLRLQELQELQDLQALRDKTYRNYRIQDLLQELLQELLQDLQEYACKEIFTLRMTWTCGMGGV